MNDTTPSMATHRHLRASDADRGMVNEVLTTAYAEGRITREELDERTSQVLAAKTFEDLAPITADLMPSGRVAVYSSPVPVQREDGHLAVGGPGFEHEADRLSAHLSTQRRANLRLRKHSSVSTIMGEVSADLVDGAMEAAHCTINLQVVMGEVNLFIPAGVRVINNASVMLGEINLRGIPAGTLDDPSITLTGSVLMGEVNVIGPEHRRWRKRAKCA